MEITDPSPDKLSSMRGWVQKEKHGDPFAWKRREKKRPSPNTGDRPRRMRRIKLAQVMPQWGVSPWRHATLREDHAPARAFYFYYDTVM
jgi:hypothetical protein